jgi:hypothetical protein
MCRANPYGYEVARPLKVVSIIMRRLLLAATTLLFLANCNKVAVPAAGVAIAASGVAVMSGGNSGPAPMDDAFRDSHSWQLPERDFSGARATAGVALVATGVAMFVLGIANATKQHDREQQAAAQQAQDAELEAWRLKMNASLAAAETK